MPEGIKCHWTYDEWYDYWETECGNAFCVMEGTPSENKMKHCPYCGKLIEEVKTAKVECG